MLKSVGVLWMERIHTKSMLRMIRTVYLIVWQLLQIQPGQHLYQPQRSSIMWKHQQRLQEKLYFPKREVARPSKVVFGQSKTTNPTRVCITRVGFSVSILMMLAKIFATLSLFFIDTKNVTFLFFILKEEKINEEET